MNRALIRIMHVCSLSSMSIALLFLAATLSDIDSFEAAVFVIALLYLLALPLGLIGWVLSIILLVRERPARTKHSVYAAFYLLFLAAIFGWFAVNGILYLPLLK